MQKKLFFRILFRIIHAVLIFRLPQNSASIKHLKYAEIVNNVIGFCDVEALVNQAIKKDAAGLFKVKSHCEWLNFKKSRLKMALIKNFNFKYKLFLKTTDINAQFGSNTV